MEIVQNNKEEKKQDAQVGSEQNPFVMTPQMMGQAWAGDAINEIVTTKSPEEAEKHLEALQHMAVHVLSMEIFNIAYDMHNFNPETSPKPEFSAFRYRKAVGMIKDTIVIEVEELRKLYAQGKLKFAQSPKKEEASQQLELKTPTDGSANETKKED